MTPRAEGRRLLFDRVLGRRGIFTVKEALDVGLSRAAITYHARTGTFERVGRGVYRFAQYPAVADDALVKAAAQLGRDAIVSHESALALYDVCDIAPAKYHFTIPRTQRYRSLAASDVVIHTRTQPIPTLDIVQHHGFRATSLARSVVDSAIAGTAPEQIEAAVRAGLERGLLTRDELERTAAGAPARVHRLVL